MKEPKIGVVLGSGGARGFCHIGVLQVLTAHNVPIHMVSGTSMGSLVGASYCSGMSLNEMEQLALEIDQGSIMDIDLTPKKKLGILRGERVTRIIKNMFGDRRIEDLPVPFFCSAVDMISARVIHMDKGEVWKAVRASIAIPMAFTPVKTDDGMLLSDGGLLCRMPVRETKDRGADIIIAIDALGPIKPDVTPTGLLKMVERCYAIMEWEIVKSKSCCADIRITPDMGNKNQLLFKNNHIAIAAGRDATVKAMPEIMQVINDWKEKNA